MQNPTEPKRAAHQAAGSGDSNNSNTNNNNLRFMGFVPGRRVNPPAEIGCRCCGSKGDGNGSNSYLSRPTPPFGEAHCRTGKAGQC